MMLLENLASVQEVAGQHQVEGSSQAVANPRYQGQGISPDWLNSHNKQQFPSTVSELAGFGQRDRITDAPVFKLAHHANNGILLDGVRLTTIIGLIGKAGVVEDANFYPSCGKIMGAINSSRPTKSGMTMPWPNTGSDCTSSGEIMKAKFNAAVNKVLDSETGYPSAIGFEIQLNSAILNRVHTMLMMWRFCGDNTYEMDEFMDWIDESFSLLTQYGDKKVLITGMLDQSCVVHQLMMTLGPVG